MSRPRRRQPKNNKWLAIENRTYDRGFKRIAGIDEAGRGPLAGPVVAAACVIAREVTIEGINDSKLLTPERRHQLYKLLTSHAQIQYGIGVVDAETIDHLNIYQATIRAMSQALDQLPEEPDYLLVDGISFVHPRVEVLKIIKGDRLSQSIAAAGIIAKGTRDALMEEYDQHFPQYGFKENKGYGTKKHLDTLKEIGPCPWHRRTFDPLKAMLANATDNLPHLIFTTDDHA